MVMLVRPVQPLKANSPILVMLEGIVISSRLSQSLKAYRPMLVTLLGMIMLVRISQSSKAYRPMLVTGCPSIVEGIVIEITVALQLVIVTSPFETS